MVSSQRIGLDLLNKRRLYLQVNSASQQEIDNSTTHFKLTDDQVFTFLRTLGHARREREQATFTNSPFYVLQIAVCEFPFINNPIFSAYHAISADVEVTKDIGMGRPNTEHCKSSVLVLGIACYFSIV